MKLKTEIILLLSFMIVLTSIIFGYLFYKTQKEQVFAGIDSKLFASATFAKELLPADYHDKLVDKTSVSSAKFLKMIDKYNKLCEELKLEYLWSLMRINGKTVFTSSTSQDKKSENGKHALFFDVHSNPELYDKTFDEMKPVYQENFDKWGRIRVVLVPFQDVNGRKFLFGASMKASDVDNILSNVMIKSLIVCLIVLALGIILSILFSDFISRSISKLSNVADSISAGKWNSKAEVKGCFEIKSLATCINDMIETRKQAHFDLENSEKHLQRSNRQVDEFNEHLKMLLNIAAHDLRIPLVNISGFVTEINMDILDMFEVLNNESLTEDARNLTNKIVNDEIPEKMKFVQEGAIELNNILSGLLELSKIAGNKLNIVNINIADLISEVINTKHLEFDKNDSKLEMKATHNCTTDVVLLKSVLTNIISNSIKFAKKDVACSIEISSYEDENVIYYVIKDNSAGIHEKDLNKIFDYCYRAADAKKFDGLGLGLSNVKLAMVRMGGDITVESEVNVGSTFTLSIPKD